MGQNHLAAFETGGVAGIDVAAAGTVADGVAIIAAVGFHTFDVADSRVVTVACTTGYLCSDSSHPTFDYFTVVVDDDLHGTDCHLDHSIQHCFNAKFNFIAAADVDDAVKVPLA